MGLLSHWTFSEESVNFKWHYFKWHNWVVSRGFRIQPLYWLVCIITTNIIPAFVSIIKKLRNCSGGLVFRVVLSWISDINIDWVRPCQNNNGGCNHICRAVSNEAVCSCRAGYLLQADQRTCEGKSKSVCLSTDSWYDLNALILDYLFHCLCFRNIWNSVMILNFFFL